MYLGVGWYVGPNDLKKLSLPRGIAIDRYVPYAAIFNSIRSAQIYPLNGPYLLSTCLQRTYFCNSNAGNTNEQGKYSDAGGAGQHKDTADYEIDL